MDAIGWLLTTAEDPFVYLPLLFVFSVLAAIVLPIPVELGLLNPFLPPWLLVLVAASGKAVGGALVFPLGRRIGARIERESARNARVERLYAWIERLVGAHGYWALFALLAIPFMTDTVPIYAFAILSPSERTGAAAAPSGTHARSLRLGPFVFVNFAAAVVRLTAFLALPILLGWP